MAAAVTGGHTGTFAPAIASNSANYALDSNTKTRDSSIERRDLSTADSDCFTEKNDWQYISELESIQEKNKEAGIKSRKLGVTWKNLCIRGAGADFVYVR